LHARNPARNIMVGGNRIVFGSVGSPPQCNRPRSRPSRRQL
jgi:trimethylamine:corrinoid methyltransferase-like protein